MSTTAAVVVVGRELLSGRVVDTNSVLVARHLRRWGIPVVRRSTVPDELVPVAVAIRRAWQEGVALVVTIGGLGPTGDDRTLAAIGLAVGRLLTLHTEAEDQVTGFYRRVGLAYDEAAGKMARLPVGAEPLVNPEGAAPGVWWAEPPRHLLALPGVPRECEAILAGLDARFEPLRAGVYRERRVSTPIVDERRLEPILRQLRRAFPDVYFKSDPQGFTGEGIVVHLDVVAPGVDVAEARLAEAAGALLDALEA